MCYNKYINIKYNNMKKDLFYILSIVALIGFYQSAIYHFHKTEEVKPVIEVKEEVKPIEIIGTNINHDWIDPIMSASKEFDVDPKLILGIAKAESSYGRYFVNPADKECNNLWGLKGGNTALRIKNEGSYIRCFNDKLAGARTVAKTLRNYYLDEGKDTPEKICQKWIGSKYASIKCDEWVANVKSVKSVAIN